MLFEAKNKKETKMLRIFNVVELNKTTNSASFILFHSKKIK